MIQQKKERQTNFELLRLLLMLTIPVYHLMLYNGVFYMDYHKNVAPGLFLSSGGAITADYAFIALTSYFLLETKDRPIIRRFLTFGAQVLTLYVIRFAVIRSLWGFDSGNWFVEDYILGGAWWFVAPYMVMLLLYPWLNQWMQKMTICWHGVLCLGLGICFVTNSITLRMNFVNDLIAFLFTYATMGYLRRKDYQRWILPTKKRRMAGIYLLGFLVTFFASWYVKMPGVMENDAAANLVVKHLIGKYAPLQFVMGLAVFFFFRDVQLRQSQIINRLAKSVFFVFLLHETVMGVYWYFGKINGQYPYYSVGAFWGWLLLYLFSCLVVGVSAEALYAKFVAPLWRRVIDRICTKFKFQ